MDLLSLLRLVSGYQLLALLRLVWRWLRPAQHRRATVHDLHLRDCIAPTFVSGSAEHVSGTDDYSTADSKTFAGAAYSSTTDSMKRRSDSNNVGAFPSSIAADPKNLRKIADANDSLAAKDTDADPKNLRKIADNSLAAPEDPKNSKATDADTKNSKAPTSASSASLSGAGYYASKNADALSSSLAAYPRSTCPTFKAPRATTRTGSTANLFHARCPHCDWHGRVDMEHLAEHATECRHRRFRMEQQLRAKREAKAAQAKANRGRFKK